MEGITLRKAIDDYRTVYMAYRNFAERTRVEYLNDLEDFVGFLAKFSIKNTKDVGLSIIERYIASLEQRGLASLTRKRKVVAIRSFLLFLYQDDYIDTNIARKIIVPFAESMFPNILTQTECNELRKVCSDNSRDALIIELLLHTGIRLSELTHLNLNDIEFEEARNPEEKDSGYIRVLGRRGTKDRLIPLNAEACRILRKYLVERRGIEINQLLLNRFKQPLGDRGVQKILRRCLKKSGVSRASIRTLRHTYGVYQFTNGTSQKNIQKIMGLKDPRSTDQYKTLAREREQRR